MKDWIAVGPLNSLKDEDVTRLDHAGHSYAIYCVAGIIYATDDLCSHEQAHLSEGLLLDHVIECPKHNGRFDVRDGRAVTAPACINLRTYEVKVEHGIVYLHLGLPAGS
jgi:3-phenylpropionate/trans-cinnamate dioxygenase ferredoxin subunit